MFDSSADFTSTDHFYDFPWPSDLRLSSTGTADLTGIANPTLSQVFEGLRDVAEQPTGFPVVPSPGSASRRISRRAPRPTSLRPIRRRRSC